MLPASSVEKILVTPPKPSAAIWVLLALNSQSDKVFPYWKLVTSWPVLTLQMWAVPEQLTTKR